MKGSIKNQPKLNKTMGSQMVDAMPKKCAHCPKHFQTMQELQMHLQIHTNQLTYRCKYCTHSFSHKSNYKAHLIKHTEEFPFKCTKCSRRYLKESSLNKHLESRVECLKLKPVYKCLICPGNCNCSSTKSDSPKQCPHCSRVLADDYELNIHMQIHSDDLAYKCPYCPLNFAHKRNIIMHMNKHLKYYPYKCNHCCDSYLYRFELLQHIRLKHEPTLEPTDNTQKDTTDKRSGILILDTHSQISTLSPSEQPMITTNFDKVRMITKALAEKKKANCAVGLPRLCLFCKATFRLKSELIKHMLDDHPRTSTSTVANRISNGFNCDYCKQKFRCQSELSRHYLKKHTKNIFKCAYCSIEFDDRAELSQHALDKHPSTSDSEDEVEIICESDSNISDIEKITEAVESITSSNIKKQHKANLESAREDEVEIICESDSNISDIEETTEAVESTTSSDNKDQHGAIVEETPNILVEEDNVSSQEFVEETPEKSKKSTKPKRKLKWNAVARLYKCNYCTKNFIRLNHLKKHLSSHADKHWMKSSYKYTTHSIY